MDTVATMDKCSLEPEDWSIMVDSDHAGNVEVQTRRRSQNGLSIELNGAPVMVESKAWSVSFASPRIGEAHADIISTGVEINSVGNATMTIMGLSYVVQEVGMIFPFPFVLEMDNDAARIFCIGTAHKTHPAPRNRDIMAPVHDIVDT